MERSLDPVYEQRIQSIVFGRRRVFAGGERGLLSGYRNVCGISNDIKYCINLYL